MCIFWVLTCKLCPTLAIVNKSITSILGTQENSFSLMGSDKVEFWCGGPRIEKHARARRCKSNLYYHTYTLSARRKVCGANLYF